MDKKLEKKLEKLCKLVRYDILTSTTVAGSGHPTSSLSAVELMTTLFFGGIYQNNDHFILSKGHASPLLYSLYHAADLIDYKELMTLRKLGSRLEGHPNPRLPYVEVATGSLGQGLSVGIGMTLGLRLKFEARNSNLKQKLPNVFVLLGDSEMAEGQVWEAMEIAGYYKLGNLVGIIDVNRLGQYGETEEGWDVHDYEKKAKAFGWETIIIDDGHNLKETYKAFNKARHRVFSSTSPPLSGGSPKSLTQKQVLALSSKPIMIIARTIKGKGVSFLENKNGWHGKALDKEQLKTALKELGKVDLKVRGKIILEEYQKIKNILFKLEARIPISSLSPGAPISGVRRTRNVVSSFYSTREAYGDALVELGKENPNIVVLDAEVANSTFENKFQQRFPDRFFEMFIAEENMMSVALGLSKIGYVPFVSTFAAFLTQTFDQVRMAQYSKGNIKIVGSHTGVSIGQDGPSQMGLEDIAMFRSILSSTVFYPSDSVSTKKLTKVMAKNQGIFYMRTTRGKTPEIYDKDEEFHIGGSKIHYIKNQKSNIKNTHKKSKIKALIISAGITLHESLKAQQKLASEGIETVVIDLYSVKPLDEKNITKLAQKYKNIVVVEDHYPAGGIGEAISSLLTLHCSLFTSFSHLCVRKIPMSGTPEELLHFEEIDAEAITKAVKA